MIQHHVLSKRYGLHDLLISFSTNCHGGGIMAGYSASYDKIEDTIVKFLPVIFRGTGYCDYLSGGLTIDKDSPVER